MHLGISQQMKMSQQMKLAPRMIQSMEILQLPVMALKERIDQELAENVTLETVITDTDVSDTEAELVREQAREEADGSALDRKELVVDNEHNNEADFERLLEMSELWPEDNVTSGGRPSSNRIDELSERVDDALANLADRPPSLHDHLVEQFRFFDVPPRMLEFGEYLIRNLDHNGRLSSTLPEIVQVWDGEITMEEAESTLKLIQKLDPPGVGARDVRECLLLQVTEETPHREVVTTLLQSHLEDLAANRLPVIQRKTGFSLEEIKAAWNEILHLDPFPGRRFDAERAQAVTPDLIVDRDESGRYVVRLANDSTPPLRISRRYRQLLRSGNLDPQTRDYIRKKIESAKWLIESIEQRNNTLKRVAQAIVDHQKDFLDKGPEFIVPLKMQQIADVVGVHVTTVSRAVDGKWMDTPRGLFALRSFFGGGTRTADGEEVAWDTIRLKLKEIVDNEDKRNPLSDDALKIELAKQGFNLARRTVTKYRQALGLPSSRQRRQY